MATALYAENSWFSDFDKGWLYSLEVGVFVTWAGEYDYQGSMGGQGDSGT